MTRVLGPAEVTSLIGGWPCGEEPSLAVEALRASISARQVTTAREAVADAVRLVSPVAILTPEMVREQLEALVEAGDVTEGSMGRVAAAPLRAVRLGAGRWKVVATLATRALSQAVPGTHIGAAVEREIRGDPAAVELAIQQLGGRLFDAAQWAGLDRAQPADQHWLDSVSARADGHGLRDPKPDAEWECYLPALDRPTQRKRWRPEADGHLWRARDDTGVTSFAWCTGGSPARQRYVPLGADDAARTAFALDRRVGAALSFTVSAGANETAVRIDALLPRAEFRYLSTLGQRADRGIWAVPTASWEAIAATLTDRLGCTFTPGGPP